jgi:glycosyltransferase involved in cell wall biosynthesis
MPKLSIVGPALNEERALSAFVEHCAQACKKLNLPYEVVIVNDGSRDKTGAAAEHLGKSHPVKVVHHRIRKGITASLADGIRAASGDIIVFLPTDLESHPQEDIPALTRPILRDEADFVIGWRRGLRGSSIGKTVLSKSFNGLASLLFGIRLHDSGWVRAFRREVVEELPPLRADWHRYMAFLAADAGFRVREIPLNYYPRAARRSSFGILGLGRIPIAFFSMLSLKMLQRFSKNPMLVFGTAGMALLALAVALGTYILYLNFVLVGNVANRTPLILLTLLFFLTGLQFLTFGFLSDLILSKKER